MLFPALFQHPKHGIRLSRTHFHRSLASTCACIGRVSLLPLLVAPLRHAYTHTHRDRNRIWSTVTVTACPSLRKRRGYQTLSAEKPGPGLGRVETVKEKFKILFMGRDEFSCLVLRQLYEAKDVWQEIVIATQPDVHVGRGGSVLSISPLKTLGQELDIPVWTIPKVKKEFRTWELPPPFALPSSRGATNTSPPLSPSPPPAPPAPTLSTPPATHLLLTASFGRILTPHMLSSFRPGQRLNVHPSLLPAYRGAAPIQWTIVNGEKRTGVCVIEMLRWREGVDAGGVWGVRGVDVPKDATFETLRDRLAVLGGKLVVDVLRDMINGKARMLPQSSQTISTPSTSTSTSTSTPDTPTPKIPKAPLITAQDGYVDFETMTAEDVDRRFRGIGHQKPLYTYTPDGKMLQLIELCPWSHTECDDSNGNQNSKPKGHTTYDKKRQSVIVRCAQGTAVCVKRVKPEGKSVRRAGEWWTGLGVVKRGEGRAGVVLGGFGGGGGGD